MSRATVIKGSLTFFDSPLLGLTQEFMFNPSEIKDTKGANWSKTSVPGISHPQYQFSAGGERIISFSLYHDGDRGRILANGLGSATSGRMPEDPGLDIAPWLRFWRALLYPASAESRSSRVEGANANFWTSKAPYRMVFNYGTFWQNVVVVVTKCDLKADFFTPKGEIVRAVVDMTLEEVPEAPVFMNNIWNPPNTLPSSTV